MPELSRDTFIDLLAIGSAAPAENERFAGKALLAREMTARLAMMGRKPWREARHPAYRLLQLGPSTFNLDALLYSYDGLTRYERQDFDPSPWFFRWYRDVAWGGCVPQEPAPRSMYDAALAEILPLADELKTRVLGEMSTDAFGAARAPFVQAFAYDDFCARQDVAGYAVLGTAAPGEAFAFETRGFRGMGYALFGSEIIVPGPGLYRTRFYGTVRSAATANPTTVRVALSEGSTELGAYTETRASADPEERVDFRHEPQRWTFDSVVDVTVSSRLTVRNGSSSTEAASGFLRLWRDA